MITPPPPARVSRRARPALVLAGLVQAAAVWSPAAQAPIAGPISFLRVETAGVLLLLLGLLNGAVALRPAGWWRWLPGSLSTALLALMYWRIVTAPSGTFIDPLLRRAVDPGWGFVPMGLAVALSLIGAAAVRVPRADRLAP